MGGGGDDSDPLPPRVSNPKKGKNCFSAKHTSTPLDGH